jgi:protein-disulfide isomerase
LKNPIRKKNKSMKLTSETKILLAIIGFTILAVVTALFIFAQPPKPITRSELINENDPSSGPKNAANYLVEFSDFQCPACKAFSTEVDKLKTKYSTKLLVVYRFFPLSQHPESHTAAAVALSAYSQGKFWEMSDLLFANQDTLSMDTYASLSAQLKLDWNKISTDITSGTYTDQINGDYEYGDKIGIDATPTFFLNGVKLSLNEPSDLTAAVERVMK